MQYRVRAQQQLLRAGLVVLFIIHVPINHQKLGPLPGFPLVYRGEPDLRAPRNSQGIPSLFRAALASDYIRVRLGVIYYGVLLIKK